MCPVLLNFSVLAIAIIDSRVKSWNHFVPTNRNTGSKINPHIGNKFKRAVHPELRITGKKKVLKRKWTHPHLHWARFFQKYTINKFYNFFHVFPDCWSMTTTNRVMITFTPWNRKTQGLTFRLEMTRHEAKTWQQCENKMETDSPVNGTGLVCQGEARYLYGKS